MAKRRKTLAGVNFDLQEIEPLTRNQLKAFESDKHLVLHGLAGTGKTFISSYLAYDDMTKGAFQRLVIIRSAVPTRDIGFLPGTEKEKASVYEEPYKDIANDLFGRGDAYEILKQKNLVEFMTTSFIRGITLRDAVVLIDECQNMSFHELDSIITRMGENTRVIFCGDFRQADLRGNGIKDFFANVLEAVGSFVNGFAKVANIFLFGENEIAEDYGDSIKSFAQNLRGGSLGKLDDGGFVQTSGVAEVHSGETYLGANSLQLIKMTADNSRKTVELLAKLANQKTDTSNAQVRFVTGNVVLDGVPTGKLMLNSFENNSYTKFDTTRYNS